MKVIVNCNFLAANWKINIRKSWKYQKMHMRKWHEERENFEKLKYSAEFESK